ncbi:hypothetical protein L3X38_026736 [Prunus dulcis]|uniref:Uncharacterized protein n=1 Tax=Prunus dulcis TaxID=3755 RepID=A0AAD4YZP9_PRUDU|nr:hypothetical protein L3X38_026736 [Prunus dulcis]
MSHDLRRLRSPSSGRHFWRLRYGNSSLLHALADGWVSRGVGYPALRQAPYVALVVPTYGEIVRYCVEVASGVGYPACRQAPYVALVVPAYGEICDMTCRIRLGFWENSGRVLSLLESLARFGIPISHFGSSSTSQPLQPEHGHQTSVPVDNVQTFEPHFPDDQVDFGTLFD